MEDKKKSEGPFFAHSLQGRPPQEWQALESHLLAVAQLAGRFAGEFGAADWGYLAGLWHDIGKYSSEFQKMLLSSQGDDAHIESRPGRIDHSTAGAIHVKHSFRNQFSPREKVLAYAIAGHHAGLADWAAGLDQRMQKEACLSSVINRIPTAIRNHPFPRVWPESSVPPNPLTLSLWIRMIFSCVLDADCLDTEAFMNPEKNSKRGGYPELSEIIDLFDDYMAHLVEDSTKTKVNEIRASVLAQCRSQSQHEPAIFTLTVPTGGGKTLSSMAFALNHAIKFQKRRIIYVNPYTSIMEQTADTFRKIFGDVIVEHHSNIDETKPSEENSRNRLAWENWDAPIIVTTAVQFFESLFACRSSKCRKLHNIVNSVLILDEAQLLPPDYLLPMLETLKELKTNYGVSIILSTATQPALTPHVGADFKFPGLSDTIEIVDDPPALYDSLSRVRFIIPSELDVPDSWEEVASRLKFYETVLCIVNSRKDCRVLHGLMPEGTIHLSALMCGAHRSKVIEDIKKRLKSGIPTRVISTQLVEAGVDIDFPVVFRALAGLDEIAQAAGRCNREGLLSHGKVFIFIPPSPAPPGHLRQAAEIGRRILADIPGDRIPLKKFEDYFRELFWLKGENLDRYKIVSLLKNDPKMSYSFKTAAEQFRIIDDQGQNCLVRYDEGGTLIDQLCESGKDRSLLRKLQRFTVRVSGWHLKKLLAGGDIVEPEKLPGLFIQVNTIIYQKKIGLCFPDEMNAYESVDLYIN